MAAATWKGVFPAMTTQFREDESLDLEATAAHIDTVIESGVHGMVMLGSLGENNALLPEEKLELVRMAAKTSNGRVPIVSGVSELNTKAACDYVRKAAEAGADGFMVLPSMAYHSDPDETVSHFVAVAQSTDLPIIIYNNPIAYKVDMTPQILERLADQKNFVAVKESSGDVRRITDIFNHLGDRYTLFCGVDDLALEAIFLGVEGWISGIGLAYPKENQQLWDWAMAGEWEKARDLYRWYMPLLHLDVGNKFVQNIKLAIQEQGMGKEFVRMPRQKLTGAEREHVLRVVADAEARRPKLS